MSWDSHIDAMKSSGADDCCICGQDGNIWGKSAGLNNITQQELAVIIKAAKGQVIQDGEKLELNGIPLMKVKELDGPNTGCNFVTKQTGEKELCCAALSGKGVVIVKKGGQNQRKAVDLCERQVQYLKDSGY
ncbi:profilin-like [Ruditapes philippinarum]|uniref:profilin-like n=1 Tax=Ruditapes philippinarum TaxID=129788 RepID=UPI00295BBF92|nr:profilin-like [Ruditapes philippinarum]